MEPASVRARHLKATLTGLAAHPRGAEVLRGLPGELVARVERSHGADWLPLEDDVLFARVTSRVLGAAEAAAFARAQLTEAFDGPVLSRMVRMGKALFGDEPGAWVRWIPHGWSLLFRGCGRWRVEVGCGGAVLHLTGLPPACAREPVWVTAVGDSLCALLDLLGRTGTSAVLGATEDGATFELRWNAAAARGAAA